MSTSDFRHHLRAPDDPRFAGIERMDAYSHAQRVLAQPMPQQLFSRWREIYETSTFKGITTDGHCRSGLFTLAHEQAPVAQAAAAAQALMDSLSETQRSALCYPLDARERRGWMNPEVYVMRFGLRLEEVDATLREAIFAVLQASLSPQGYRRVRDLMRVNHFLGELVNAPGVLNEFSYNFNLFGTPSPTQPWAWNFYGHHVCLSCTFIGAQMVLTPVFMGAEPNIIDVGPHAGQLVFAAEEKMGLDFMRSLPPEQQRQARLYEKKRDPAMPAGRVAIGDELNLIGAFQDNRVIPYEGLSLSQVDPARYPQLLELVESYLAYIPEGPRKARLAEVQAHLAETYFCWIGGVDDDSTFYYRLQSPVLIIEFDHHAGVFLGNPEPERFHIHTLVRTPNGNDYGMDIIRQHCACQRPVRLPR